MLGMFFFIICISKQVDAQEENEQEVIDVSQGWEVVEFNASYPEIMVDQIFSQGYENSDLNQRMAMVNFANIGKSSFTAKKVINLKKNKTYLINLVYAMSYTKEGSGFIDFNGDKKISDEDREDKIYQDTIQPTEDMEYVITSHFDTPMSGSGYFKIGYNLSNGGFIQEDIKGKVISKFESEEGEELLPPQELEGNIGEQYEVIPPEIEGWELTEIPSNSKGEYGKEIIEIVFIYKRRHGATVTVKYLDEDNEEISPTLELNGLIGETYTSEAKNIEHYSLIEKPMNMSGKFTNEPQTVIYKYQGSVYFQEIPQTISFGLHEIPADDSTFFVQEINGLLSIRDLRKLGSSWEVSAQLKQEFLGINTNKGLKEQLNYIDSDGNSQIINSKYKTIIENHVTEEHDAVDISRNWVNNNNLSLAVVGGSVIADNYEAIIEWTLTEGVENN